MFLRHFVMIIYRILTVLFLCLTAVYASLLVFQYVLLSFAVFHGIFGWLVSILIEEALFEVTGRAEACEICYFCNCFVGIGKHCGCFS